MAIKQLRNKKHAEYKKRMSFCKNGSKKHKRLKQAERKSSAKFTRQQLGKKCSLKLSQWAHGLFYGYLNQKSRACGMNNDYLNEASSSKTCSVCGHVRKSSVKGRTYKGRTYQCSACKSVLHRDGNGSANICSKGRYGEHSKVQVMTTKYLQPVYVRHPQKCSSSSEAGQVAVQAQA